MSTWGSKRQSDSFEVPQLEGDSQVHALCPCVPSCWSTFCQREPKPRRLGSRHHSTRPEVTQVSQIFAHLRRILQKGSTRPSSHHSLPQQPLQILHAEGLGTRSWGTGWRHPGISEHGEAEEGCRF